MIERADFCTLSMDFEFSSVILIGPDGDLNLQIGPFEGLIPHL